MCTRGPCRTQDGELSPRCTWQLSVPTCRCGRRCRPSPATGTGKGLHQLNSAIPGREELPKDHRDTRHLERLCVDFKPDILWGEPLVLLAALRQSEGPLRLPRLSAVFTHGDSFDAPAAVRTPDGTAHSRVECEEISTPSRPCSKAWSRASTASLRCWRAARPRALVAGTRRIALLAVHRTAHLSPRPASTRRSESEPETTGPASTAR